jgi:hypothetical protein
MQLDLFIHDRSTLLRNDLVRALRERQPATGREACAKLADESPEDALLAPALRLIERLETPSVTFSSHQDAQRAAEYADSVLSDAAAAVFGARRGDEWMAPVWLALADAGKSLSYRRDVPTAHSAYMLVRGRHWHAAEAAIARIPAWRRVPEPLAWMAETLFRIRGFDAAWPLLAELAWRAPKRFAHLEGRLDAPALIRLLREFTRESIDDDFAWFPAWALIAEAKLADGLCGEPTPEYSPPEQAARTVRQLLTLERQGRHHEIVEKRKTLRALHPELFAHYMRTRA